MKHYQRSGTSCLDTRVQITNNSYEELKQWEKVFGSGKTIVQITNNSYEELKLTVLTSIAIVSAIVQITNNSYEELKLGIHRDANAPGSLGSNNQ